MTDPLPKFDAPPVVETVLSIQFEPLPRFTGAMAGRFWQSHLMGGDNDWPASAEVPALPDVRERFGDDVQWKPLGVQIGSYEGRSQRTQIMRADDQRMVQIQDSRLILNWKKGQADYPSYEVLYPEFLSLFEGFKAFSSDSGFDDLSLNQWEVTYVNHILKGDLWNSPYDWGGIAANLAIPKVDRSIARSESGTLQWKFIIGENLGRLHVSSRHVKVAPGDEEAIRLELTARGSINDAEDRDIKGCFDLGHETIVRFFTAITSDTAHKVWKRTA